MQSLQAPEAISHLLSALIENMSDEVNLTISHPQLGL
jgi:hypothetical protein